MTFARMAKVLAVFLIGAALWWARPPQSPARIAFLVVPGASSEVFPSAGARSSAGKVEAPSSTGRGAPFWRRLFAAVAEDNRDPLDRTPLWASDPVAMQAFAVPARLFATQERLPSVEATFVGGSSGVRVEEEDVSSGRLPVPYDRALDVVTTTTARLRAGEWSDWIAVEPHAFAAGGETAPIGEFQFSRTTDDAFFFSPVYRTPLGPTVGAPFLRGLPRDLRPIVAEHTMQRASRLSKAWPERFRVEDEGALIFFDTVAEDVTAVFAPDSVPSALIDRLQDAVSSDLALLRRSVGDRGLVVVLGGPSSSRGAGAEPWYAVVQGGEEMYAGGSVISTPLRFEEARVLLRYLAGVALVEAERPLLPKEIALQYPIPVTMASVTMSPTASPPEESWSASSIELLRGALGLGS